MIYINVGRYFYMEHLGMVYFFSGEAIVRNLAANQDLKSSDPNRAEVWWTEDQRD